MNPKRPPVRHRGRAAHLRLLQAAGLVEFLALQRRRLAGRPQRDADAMRN
ncbi:MAG: hypothetical protein MUF44_09215 [Hydrogenophaga sp.]|nr:hypothetical protein [Hydrogenophaga sp.]